MPLGKMSISSPQQPSWPRRLASSLLMGVTGLLCKGFIFGLNRTEVIGLDEFTKILEARKDPAARERGLLTVCNHISVMDDPLIWGVLPMKYGFDPKNLRWSLGSHDICYASKALSNFFFTGQTLPMHRLNHSPLGGLFQPTMTQTIRLLSSQPFYSQAPADGSSTSSLTPLLQPTASPPATYSTTPTDSWPAPSLPLSNRHAWVHIFPEGMIHQKFEDRSMRYFKWGVARLVLEAEPMPAIVPMFVDGTDQVMDEARTFPRFLPRIGKRIRVVFGAEIDGESAFGDLRRKWHALVDRERRERLWRTTPAGDGEGASEVLGLGELPSEELKFGKEAEAIRVEVTRRMRDEILKLRRGLGYPDEDPKLALAETWAKDIKQPRHRSQVDGSVISQE